MKLFDNLLNVPVTDPDDARRRKLLNILILCFLAGTLIGAAVCSTMLVSDWANLVPTMNLFHMQIPAFVTGVPVTLVASIVLWLINRYSSGLLASSILLLSLTASIFTNKPEAVISSHLILTFAIPVVIASFLLRSYASFIMAGLVALALGAIEVMTPDIGFQVPPMLTLFMIAFVSWFAARSLEQALKAARLEAGKSRAILEGIADGVLVFDNAWRVSSGNPAMAALLGQPAEEVVGRDVGALMGAGAANLDARAWAALREMLESGQVGRFEWGGKVLSASLSPVRGEGGAEVGKVAVLRDVTQEVETQRAKESLFAVSAHELRTPLNAIINFASMLRAGVLPPEEQQEAAARIAANGERLLILANNLLERAQMEAGKMRLAAERFAPVELLEGVRGVTEVLAQEKGLELRIHAADNVPAVLVGDKQRLHQILVNLVGNAVKFTEAGRIEVRVTVPDASHWALAVSDTGMGIPEEALARIFEPFELAEDPATRKHAGAGLGLSIVKQLVSLMGGELTVESGIGRGSTFTVMLPLAPSGSPDKQHRQG